MATKTQKKKKIHQLRVDISIITENTTGNTTNKIRRKLKTILKKYKITADEQLIACKEDLKQTLQSQSRKSQKIYQKK